MEDDSLYPFSNGPDRNRNLPEPELRVDLASLAMERDTLGENEIVQAQRIFREGLPAAAMSIVTLSMHSPNDTLRYKAAQYVVERNLGKVGEAVSDPQTDDPLTEWIKTFSSVDSLGN